MRATSDSRLMDWGGPPLVKNTLELMSNSEEMIKDGIAHVMKEPDRDFTANPLTQPEVMAVIETLIHEVNDPEIDDDLAQFYISCIEFLKAKVLYN